ncbi:MAG: hypothetical protein INR62_02305 [Rhodospirillales bacterium]|nr:hypothetical protein [Acetobacter sp.]
MTTFFSFENFLGPRHSLAACSLLVAAFGMPAVSHAQSSMNWLATAPVPNRAMLFGSATALARSSSSLEHDETSTSSLEAPLPEAPLPPQLATEPKPKHGTDPSEHIAQKWTMSIPSDWKAQRLTAGDKAKAGLTDMYSFETVASWFLAAGWEQLNNGAPNYGTDKGAFGQRLGAAAIRSSSQNLFSEVILAPVLREDARYYVEGPKYNVIHRTVYAVTRTLVTRTDNGGRTINGALLLGYAGAAALTPTYYPQDNRNFADVASVFGGGIGGAALGFFITEFSQDTLRALHLARRP